MLSCEYCAGFFDGEGTVIIRYDKRCDSYILKVAVANCVKNVLIQMQDQWGGSIFDVSPKQPNHSGFSEWYLQGGGAEPFLRAIYPFCVIKKEQIDIAFELLATRVMTPGRGRRLPQEIKDMRLSLKNRIHEIKTKGKGLRGAH